MNRLASLSIAVLLSVIMLLVASLPRVLASFSAQPPVDTSTYRAGTIGLPRRLDPSRAYDTASGEIIQNVYQPLIFFGDKPLLPPTTAEITDRYVADLGNFTSSIAIKVPSIADGDISADGKNWTFAIRPGVRFHDWTAANGSLIRNQILTTEDVVYTFKRMLVQDMSYGPSWMIALPATGHKFFDDLDANASTNTIEPVGVPGVGERFAASLIDGFITSNDTTVTFHWVSVWPETLLKQILSQTWSCIVNKAFCIEHGCWNHSFYDGWSTDYRRMPSNLYTPLDGYCSKSKYPSSAPDVPNMCGTGPYKFTYCDNANGEWRIDKFIDYWGGWAGSHVTTVIEKSVAEWPMRKELFLSGEFDDCLVPIDNMLDLLNPSDPTLHTPLPGITLYYNAPGLSNNALIFVQSVDMASPYMSKNGTTPAPDLFGNVHMRRAFSHALNFTQYLKGVWSNEAIRSASWWVKGLNPDYENKTLIPHDLNTTAIQEELKAAGVWDAGFETTLVYVLGSIDRSISWDMVAATFASLGNRFRCNVVGVDWPTLLDCQQKFFMPIFSVGWKADFGDPENFARTYMHSRGDIASMQKYNDTYIDYLIDRGISQPDGPARNATYQELQYIHWRDVPSLPLSQSVSRRWQRDWVRGWYYNPLYPGLYFYDLYKTQVSKLGTSITLALTPSVVKKGGSTTVAAKLLDENGNPIANQAVVFSMVATSLGSTDTDSSGNAVMPYTASVDAGIYVVTAYYAGSVDFASSIGMTNLIVSLFAATALTIDVPSATQGQAVTLKATLKDENGSPIQGLSIQFQMYDGVRWSDLNSGYTDSNGVASIIYTPSSIGSFQVKAIFGGTIDYAPSASTSADLNVGVYYTPYYVGGGVIAMIVLGAVGYLIFRRRKKNKFLVQSGKVKLKRML